MRRALLDVNVLLALFDPDHVDHRNAHDWLDAEIGAGWASCAITENGFVRVISQPRYPSPIKPAQAISLFAHARRNGPHVFWPCDLSLLDAGVIDPLRVHGPRQVTDAYLLALATANDGRLVSFDRTVSLDAVAGATASNLTVL